MVAVNDSAPRKNGKSRRRRLRQAHFIAARLKGATQAEAAEAAGFVSSDAQHNSKKSIGCTVEAEVAHEIELLRNSAIDLALVDASFVMKRLVVESLRAGEASSRIRALELIGKERGMFVDRRMTLDAQIRLSDNGLMAAIQAGNPSLWRAISGALTPLPVEVAAIVEDAGNNKGLAPAALEQGGRTVTGNSDNG